MNEQIEYIDATENLDRHLASVEKIGKIESIEGADKIVFCSIKGWDVVIKKDEFKEGDLCIYVEIDSILPEIPCFEFMRPRGFRIKTIKLRNQISQGIIFPLTNDFLSSFGYQFVSRENKNYLCEINNPNNLLEVELGTDLTQILGLKKYIAKESFLSCEAKGNFPSFFYKTDEERMQNLIPLLEKSADIDVYITAKLDGSSYSAFYNRINPNEPSDNDFGVCSRNLLLKESDSTFWKVTYQYDLKNKLTKYCKDNNRNIAIQGELIGNGVQGNKYRLKGLDLYIFNIYDITEKKFLSMKEIKIICNDLGLKVIPEIEKPLDFKLEKDYLINLSIRKSILNKDIWEEGIIIRSIEEKTDIRGTSNKRFTFKVINPEFLLKNNE